jgi:hypothetical protein
MVEYRRPRPDAKVRLVLGFPYALKSRHYFTHLDAIKMQFVHPRVLV